MKKKLVAAAVMAALTLSASSVFAAAIAAPTFSGDANIEYSKKDNEKGELTNRIRLVIDCQIDKNLFLHGRYVANNDINTNDKATPVWQDKSTKLEQAYILYKAGNADFIAGRQPLFLGHGLLSDINGISGLKVNTAFNDVKLLGFSGKDDDENVSAADFSTTFGNLGFGLSYLKKTDNYYGVNANTKIADNVVLNLEYVKNNDKTIQNKGYWAEVKVGNAVKKGQFDYSLAYLNVEDQAVDGAYVTESNMKGGKGLRVKTHYAVSDNSTLIVYHDMFKNTVTDKDQKRTDLEFEVRF